MLFKQKRIYLGLFLALVVLGLTGCSLFVKPNVTVEGIVTMGDGESPLGPSKIYVDNEFKVETAEDGKFSISLKPGEYKLHAVYNEKKSDEVSVTLKSEKVTANFKIDGLGHLSGSVKTADDLAIPGAKLKLGSLELPLDANGNYSMFVEPGEQKLEVEYKGFVYSETYTMPEGNATKDIKIADLAIKTLTLVKTDGSAQAGVSVDIALGEFKDTVETDENGAVSFIAPTGEGTFKFALPIPELGVNLEFNKTATLNPALELVADIAEKRVFFDDFTSDTGAWILDNAIIGDGKITSISKTGRGLAWLTSKALGTDSNYIAVVKGIGSGAGFRVNAYVPDDLESLSAALFRGYQSAIYVKGTPSPFQLSSFHGPGAPGVAPWWGHKRDLEFNNGLTGGEPTHPIVELGSAYGYAYNPDVETMYAISIAETPEGNNVTVYFEGNELITVVDTDAPYDYEWGTEAYQHQGGGIFLSFEINETKDFNVTEVAVYKID